MRRPALLVLVLLVSSPALAAQNPVLFAADVTVELGTVGPATVSHDRVASDNGAGAVVTLPGMFPGIQATAEIAAFEISESPSFGRLLVLDTATALPGLPAGSPAEPRDVVRYDPGTATYSTIFDGSAHSVPDGAAIDALASAGEQLLISFDTTVTLPGAGTVDDEDVVTFSAGTFAMFLDSSSVEGLPSELDLDAVHMVGLTLLRSFDGSGSVGGVAFDDEDVVALDILNTGYAMYFDGSASDPADWPAADLVALPEPGVGLTLFTGAVALVSIALFKPRGE